jgi:hypothetical protein
VIARGDGRGTGDIIGTGSSSLCGQARQARRRKMSLRRGLQLLGKLLLAILSAAVPLMFALYLHLSMMLMGFPDNHVTDYDKANIIPTKILIFVSLVVALYVCYRSFRVRRSRDILCIGVVLSSYTALFFLARYFVDIYLIEYLQLDFGQGG